MNSTGEIMPPCITPRLSVSQQTFPENSGKIVFLSVPLTLVMSEAAE